MADNLSIMLHDVKNGDWFDNIISYLVSKYEIISVQDYLANKTEDLKKPFCIITADDGRKSFYETVFPLLKKYQVPATLFISPKIIKSKENYWFQDVQMMDKKILIPIVIEKTGINQNLVNQVNVREVMKLLPVDDIMNIIDQYKKIHAASFPPQNITLDNLKEIKTSGLVNFGAHTQTHPILANESDERSKQEIVESVSELSDLIGEQVISFAYPNGNPNYDFGEREKLILKNTGIKIAFSTRIDHIRENDDKYDIPRIGLTYGNMFFVKTKLHLGKKWNVLKSVKNKTLGTHRDQLIKSVQ